MRVGLCYESVLPNKGGAETYLGDLARRLVLGGHEVHLFASRWDANSLPAGTVFRQVPAQSGPRFLRPWRFAAACLDQLARFPVDVSVGFDKTYGQDVLYPQGGLHAASREHNLRKFATPVAQLAAKLGKALDPAARSFALLERRQYLARPPKLIVANSRMVAGHFARYYGLGPDRVRVVHSAIDPARFAAPDRAERRAAFRAQFGLKSVETAGLFVGTNYRLKGLAPLLRGLAAARSLPGGAPRLVVVGHPKFARYARLAQRLGVAHLVSFAGFRADPRDAYFAADFLAHPTFYDPCSLVALEALACGLPVLTTRFNGAAELLGGAGVVVDDPHDAHQLGAALALLSDPAARSGMAALAPVAASHWTFEDHYHALVAIFESVAGAARWRG